MTYSEFAKETPVLYGYMMANGKQLIGVFKPIWNKYSNTLCYFYMGKNGRKTKYGMTLIRTFSLVEMNRLSADPANGDPANYL